MLFSFYHLEQGHVMDILGHLSQLCGVETGNLYFRTSFQVDLTAVQVGNYTSRGGWHVLETTALFDFLTSCAFLFQNPNRTLENAP